MPPPKLNAVPISKSILYDKRIVVAATNRIIRRAATEKIIIPRVVLAAENEAKKK